MYPACTLFCHFLPLILWDFAAQFGYTLLKLTHLFFMFHLLEYLSHELSHKVISLSLGPTGTLCGKEPDTWISEGRVKRQANVCPVQRLICSSPHLITRAHLASMQMFFCVPVYHWSLRCSTKCCVLI